jgi:hypothetical protein
MIRRVFFSMFVFALLGLSMTASAQSDPLPVPSDATAPVGPIERTEADLEAIRQLEEAGMRAARSMTPRAISHFIMPTTINVGITPTVHCDVWVNSGRPVTEVITMDLREYVKNVLPHEWGRTWPDEALRAGAVAVKMFAWWRINITEQYPGAYRPVGVHVVDNTCDQVFWPDSDYPTTNNAVDYTWPYRLHENEFVREIHYLATEDQCQNAMINLFWTRCLPQRATEAMAYAGASWQDMIYQYYSPISISVMNLTDLAPNTNLMRNSNFSDGTSGWTVVSGALGAGVTDGVFSYYRGTTDAARLRQEASGYIGANAPLKMVLHLGNSSGVPKQVTVNIGRLGGGDSAGSCTFTLDPNSPPQKHIVWGVTPSSWPGVRVQITADSADDTPAYLIDNVKLLYIPGGNTSIPCTAPAPGKPKFVTPVSNTMYDNDLTVQLTEGKSNYRTGYDAAFHIQIDNNSDFSSPLFDNGGAMADEPSVTTYLPGRTWYIRARQFDGIDRYSPWTATVPFMTDKLPDTPVLNAPLGDVPAAGQSFVWTNGKQTTRYQLIVVKPSGKVEGKFSYTLPSAFCGADVCSVPLDSLSIVWKPGKAYTWFVKAFNATDKAKSTKHVFTLIAVP